MYFNYNKKNMKTINISLTEKQGQDLMQIMDLATKAGGLNTAVLALPIAKEIETALYPKEDNAEVQK